MGHESAEPVASSTQTTAPAQSIDFVPQTLLAAVDTALEQANHVVDIMEKEVDDYMQQLLESTKVVDPVDKQNDPQIAPFYATLELSLATAQNAYANTLLQNQATWNKAHAAWQLALATCKSAVLTAKATVTTTLSTDQTASKINGNSKSRDTFLYYTLKATIAQVLETFYGTVASAQAALANAAGTAISALVTEASAVASAEATRQNSIATAYATFRQSVENAVDA